MKKYKPLLIIILGLIFLCLYDWPDKGHFVLIKGKMPFAAIRQNDFSGIDGLKVALNNGKKLHINQENKAEIIDLVTNSRQSLKPPQYSDYTSAIKLKNGNVLLIGGLHTTLRGILRSAPTLFYSICEFPSGAEIFNPETNTFRKTGNLNIPRRYAHATLLQNGNVLITGGQDCSSCDSGDVLSFCRGTDKAELYIPE